MINCRLGKLWDGIGGVGEIVSWNEADGGWNISTSDGSQLSCMPLVPGTEVEIKVGDTVLYISGSIVCRIDESDAENVDFLIGEYFTGL